MKNKFIILVRNYIFAALLLILCPLPVLAVGQSWPPELDSGAGGGAGAGASTNTTLGSVFTKITSTVLKPLIALLLTLAVVVFFWGMVKYIYSLGEKEKSEGRWLMVWGIIALFVMVSVWGLTKALVTTFDLDNSPVENIVIPAGN